MRALRDHLETRDDLRSLAEIASGFPIVSAVHVEPNPLYLTLHCLAAIAQTGAGAGASPEDTAATIDRICASHDFSRKPDFDALERLEDWQRRALRPYMRPASLLMRVHVNSRKLRESGADSGLMLGELVHWCEAQSRKSDVIVVAQERAEAVAALAPGEGVRAVGGRGSGTLGGFLETSAGDHFAVTCAHVAGLGAQVEDGAQQPIGTCRHATQLVPAAASPLCRPGSGGGSLDAALIDCAPGRASATGLRASQVFGSGKSLQMQGARSGGPRRYYFGSLGLTQMVKINDTPHCFENVVSFRPQSALPLGRRLSCALGHRPMRGDSGAWLTDPTGTEWFAMMFAVDGTEGFAVDATDCLTWARAETGDPGLSVF